MPNGRSRHFGSTDGEYSVVQTFVSGEQEYVRAWVSAEEAAEAFHHYTHNVSVKLGFTTEVIITDGGDQTNMRWEKGKGITFPDAEAIEKMRHQQALDAGMLEHEPAEWERTHDPLVEYNDDEWDPNDVIQHGHKDL